MKVNCKIYIEDLSGHEGDDIEKTIARLLYVNNSSATVTRTHEEIPNSGYPSRYNFTYQISGLVTAISFYEIFQFVEDFDAVLR